MPMLEADSDLTDIEKRNRLPEKREVPARRSSTPPLLALAVCVVVSLAVGAGAYVVGRSLPKTFQNDGTIRIGTPTQGGIDDSAVDAANDLTSEYAQLVNSEPVAAIVARRLGASSASIRGKLAGSSVSGENILQVTASASTPAQATAVARAGTQAVKAYLMQQTQAQNSLYTSNLASAIRKANAAGVAATTSTQIRAQALSQQDNALYEALRDAAGNQPTFQVVDPVGATAIQVEPKPKLYGVVGFIIMFLLSLRIAFIIRSQR